ncbi:serine hydrolase [Sphingomonas histidinilytica]|uniref:CubicO group peptidase, beta-lactamase class C family n=2 Tax=Rhizorhabdus histidinilytica TaxID=439228 RepID=A0A1T5BM02_9SPHN|nr:serine hydrolase [Rhizorhabdus histidinilytica]SKB48117.1 CubicO group peptidase, beta-lactamase class C family [Rhizorhabdus histidinilytica]
MSRFMKGIVAPAIMLASIPQPVLAYSLGHSDPKATGFSAAGLDRVTDFFEDEVRTGRIPGAIVLIQRNDKAAYFEGFGVRDPATKTPMTPDTIFRIYSMTKPVVSVAAMMLVEEGRLALDEPLSTYIPSFANMKVGVERKGVDGKIELELVEADRPITIQDLMRHTSGIVYGFFGADTVNKMYLRAGLFDPLTLSNEEYVERVAKLPLRNQPGTTWDYGYGTDVLGRVVEIVSGQSLYGFLKDRLFDPLGMNSTSFYVADQAKFPMVAEPFPKDRFVSATTGMNDPREPRKWESAGGGLVSTPVDYLRFAQMLLHGGALDGKRYLSPKTVAFMTSNHIGPSTNIKPNAATQNALMGVGYGFGLGFAVRTDPGDSPKIGSVGEFSWLGFAGTEFWVDPKEGMIAIMMTQTMSGQQRIRMRQRFHNLVYGAFEK